MASSTATAAAPGRQRAVELCRARRGVGAVLATAWAWRTSDNRALKAALLLSATALTSAHILDYNLLLLAPALAFLTLVVSEDGARDYEKSWWR